MGSEAAVENSSGQDPAHEFVNALSSVRSLADLLAENPGLDEGERSRFICIIRDEAKRLAHLVAHLNLETAPRLGTCYRRSQR
jgi:nitrogen-specific signal transduction histidine kinase